MANKEKCVDVCNSLLRGELSAVETYNQAIEKFTSDPAGAALTEIRAEHEDSVSLLSKHLIEMGAQPATSSGAWGTFAQAVEGVAKAFGASPALAALIEGEEHGQKEYRDALDNEDVMESIKSQIRSTLLPRLTAHVPALERLRNR